MVLGFLLVGRLRGKSSIVTAATVAFREQAKPGLASFSHRFSAPGDASTPALRQAGLIIGLTSAGWNTLARFRTHYKTPATPWHPGLTTTDAPQRRTGLFLTNSKETVLPGRWPGISRAHDGGD